MRGQLVRNLTELLFPGYKKPYQLPTTERQHVANTLYVLPYRHKTVRNVIKHAKYYRERAAIEALAQTLNTVLDAYGNQPLAIIPIPQSRTRWRERGFDHLQEIINASSYADCLLSHALQKSVHTKRQAHVDKHTRTSQQAGSFRGQLEILSGLRGTVVLFDDVITTGSTMSAARASVASQLHPNTTLVCLALAH